MAWPTEHLYPVPEHMDDTVVALLEPLGAALHAFDLGQVRFASTVGVVGPTIEVLRA